MNKNSVTLALCAALAAPAAWSTPVTIQFSGTVTDTFSTAADSALAGRIHTGDHYTGQFTYDDATMPAQQTATFAQYAAGELSVRIGDFTERTDAARISIGDTPARDSFYIWEPPAGGGLPRPLPPLFVSWVDPSAKAFDGTALPMASSWPLVGFPSASAGGEVADGHGDFQFYLDVRQVNVAAAVPEPAGFAMVLGGLAVAAGARRRRRGAAGR